MRRSIAVLALLFAASPGAAYAQNWSAYDSAFPLLPCQDGWAGCRVDGRALSPELQSDGTGAPTPANQRLGWFDLEPTMAFSPFAPLSVYTGEEPTRATPAPVEEEPDAVAVADPDPAPAAAPAPPPAPRAPSAEELAAQRQAEQAAETARQREAEQRQAAEAVARAEAERRQREAEREEAARRQAELDAQAQRAADQAERARLQREAEEQAARARQAEEARRRAEEEQARQEAERQRREQAAAEAARKAEEERQRAEAERKRAEEEAARQAAAQRAAEEAAAAERAAAERAAAEAAKQAAEQQQAAAKAPEDDGVTAVATPEAASCEVGELVRLEPMAMLGKLTAAQVQACEESLAQAPRMTDKDKISRVLMGNAFSKGDKAGWERLVKRHLDEIDQSDPDLCYKYALHLSNGGPARATGVIRWANVALENRTVWVGDTYTSRVNSLYKLRASAAQTLWRKAEEEFAANPSDEGKRKMDSFRDQTKVLAREWLEYAKAANRDHTQALQLCMSAAGTSDYCEAR